MKTDREITAFVIDDLVHEFDSEDWSLARALVHAGKVEALRWVVEQSVQIESGKPNLYAIPVEVVGGALRELARFTQAEGSDAE